MQLHQNQFGKIFFHVFLTSPSDSVFLLNITVHPKAMLVQSNRNRFLERFDFMHTMPILSTWQLFSILEHNICHNHRSWGVLAGRNRRPLIQWEQWNNFKIIVFDYQIQNVSGSSNVFILTNNKELNYPQLTFSDSFAKPFTQSSAKCYVCVLQ